MSRFETRWTYLSDRDATFAVGHCLGERLVANPSIPRIFAAIGDLGAGKTSLAQGLARGVGVPATTYVNSPTFALHQTHIASTSPYLLLFHHLDLYRLGDEDELIQLGFEELLESGVSYIEWPQRAPSLLARTAHLRLRLYHLDEWNYSEINEEDGRVLSITGERDHIDLLLSGLDWLTYTVDEEA